MLNFFKGIAVAALASLTACAEVASSTNAPAVQGDTITATELNGLVTVTSVQFGSHGFPKPQVCDAETLYVNDSPHWTAGRQGSYLTLAGQLTTVNCGPMPSGGGNDRQSFVDEWEDSPLVEDDGSVTINPGETVTEHPSTDPEDSGFDGEGPPSIDG